MSELVVEAVPSGEGVEPAYGWLIPRENYDFTIGLPRLS
jgi:hypothetical protein